MSLYVSVAGTVAFVGSVNVKLMLACSTDSLKVAVTAVLAAMPCELACGLREITIGSPDPCATVNVAVALVKPVADAVIVAVPAVLADRLDVAIPADGATGETGLNVPVTPLTENVIALVAVETVLLLAS